MSRSFQTRGTLTCLIALLLSAAFGQPVLGQGTTFTYQGQLKDGGMAVNGPYDLTFRLFPSEVGGAPIGLTVALPATAVTDGLFTVSLDFGAGVFDGTPRWL